MNFELFSFHRSVSSSHWISKRSIFWHSCAHASRIWSICILVLIFLNQPCEVPMTRILEKRQIVCVETALHLHIDRKRSTASSSSLIWLMRWNVTLSIFYPVLLKERRRSMEHLTDDLCWFPEEKYHWHLELLKEGDSSFHFEGQAVMVKSNHPLRW